MIEPTWEDVWSLVIVNLSATPGDTVEIQRDEDEGIQNYRAKRLQQLGWVSEIDVHSMLPQYRSIGVVTEEGAKIIDAGNTEYWDELAFGEMTVAEFVQLALDMS